jgi:glucosamine--fructose-6-phosphate aminotransferase (isomerizing)
MCGIVGYIGIENSKDVVLEGLKRLEYRGYDSAGIFLSNGESHETHKVKGGVDKLKELVSKKSSINSNISIAHTRWATHGLPNKNNAHPHISNSGELILVHNGIIENYDEIRKELISRGYHFNSDTDSEILINLIEEIKIKDKLTLFEAVKVALTQIIGAYGLVCFDKNNTESLVVARLGSPLCIGIKKDGFFVGSDATPFIDSTRDVIYLEDFEMTELKYGSSIKTYNVKTNEFSSPNIETLKWNLESIQKGGYSHFMLKEIFEQPKAIENTFSGRLIERNKTIKLSGLDDLVDRIDDFKRIIIIGCGTSWHAGLVGEYLFEKLIRIPVEVEYASEFRYRNPIISSDDFVIVISQSGETADTLEALKIAKQLGAYVFGICNVVGSSIARETFSGLYTHAGPEIGVASTKAFLTQIAALQMLALKLASIKKTLNKEEISNYFDELKAVPIKISQLLKNSEKIKRIAQNFFNSNNALFLGRGFNFPVALEGALKMKEISYIHSEGYPAAEMKHGPIALVDKDMPVIIIATRIGNYEKIVSNVQEIKSRNGKVISIVSEGDQIVKNLSDDYIEIPKSNEIFTPFYATIPLQLLSFYVAIERGCNVDQPRNLAKSVTVE